MKAPRRSWARGLAGAGCAVVALLACLLLGRTAAATSDPPAGWQLLIGASDTASSSAPIPLSSDRSTKLTLRLPRTTPPVTIRAIRLVGRAYGMDLFSYLVPVTPALSTAGDGERSVYYTFEGLGGQASGRVPVAVTLIDSAGRPWATGDFTADVSGSFWSPLGFLGLGLLAIALLLGTGCVLLLRLASPQARRWAVPLTAGVAGLVLGSGLSAMLAVTGAVAPTLLSWLVLSAGLGLVAAGGAYALMHSEQMRSRLPTFGR